MLNQILIVVLIAASFNAALSAGPGFSKMCCSDDSVIVKKDPTATYTAQNDAGAVTDNDNEEGVVNISLRNRTPKCALKAFKNQQYDRAMEMLNNKEADVNDKDSAGCTLVHLAVLSNQKSFLGFLLDFGADTKLQDDHGSTALHYAVARKNKELLKLLLNKGAVPCLTIEDNQGMRPIDIALGTKEPHLDIVERLLNANKPLASSSAPDGQTLLHNAAVVRQDVDLVKVLLSFIKDPSVDQGIKNNSRTIDIVMRYDNIRQEIKALFKPYLNYSQDALPGAFNDEDENDDDYQ